MGGGGGAKSSFMHVALLALYYSPTTIIETFYKVVSSVCSGLKKKREELSKIAQADSSII